MDRDLENLLTNALFVRSVARGLLRDDDAVDDVVQQTWLAALRRPPGVREYGLRSWLKRVVTNLSLNRRRASARRAANERAVDSPPAIPLPEAILHRETIRQSVVQCVLALADPYRTVVLLRYFEGLAPEAIARSLDVPLDTVKTRLRRARDLLRESLTRKHGGETTWLPAMLQLAGGPVALVVTASLFKAKWVAAALLLLLASAAVAPWIVRSNQTLPGSVPIATGVEPVGGESAAATPTRDEVVATPAANAIALAASTSAAEPAILAGRFVDADGVPLEHVTVAPESESDVVIESDASGAFRWVVPLPAPDAGRDALIKYGAAPELRGRDSTVRLHATKRGFVKRDLDSVITFGATVSLGLVTLEAAGLVVGRVVDADGRPVVGARIIVADVERPDVRQSETARVEPPAADWLGRATSDLDGRFRVDDVRPGWVQAWATAPECFYASAPPAELRARATVESTIELDPAQADHVISGVVVGPDGFAVKARVSLYCGTQHQQITTADALGAFRLLVAQLADYSLRVMDDTYVLLPATVRDVRPGNPGLVIHLERAPAFEVVVLDQDMRLVASSYVAMRTVDGDHAHGQMVEGGKTEMHALDRVFSVNASAPGFLAAEVGPYAADAMPSRVEITLHKLPSVTGRITFDGEPVPRARVSILAAPARGSLMAVHSFPSRVIPERGPTALGADDGLFAIASNHEGEFLVRVEADGFAPVDAGPFTLRVTSDDVEHDFALVRGGTIEGRVLLPPGRSLESVILGISNGDGFPRTQRVSADGAYRFAQLAPGRWLVQVCEREIHPDQGSYSEQSVDVVPSIPWNCVVVDGAVTRYDFDLTVARECIVRGAWLPELAARIPCFATLVRADAISAHPTQIQIEQESRARATVASDGTFTMTVAEPGAYVLFLSARDGDAWFCFGDRIELGLGDQRWGWHHTLGSFAGHGVADAPVKLTWSDVGASYVATTRADDAGEFSMAAIPTGQIEVRLGTELPYVIEVADRR